MRYQFVMAVAFGVGAIFIAPSSARAQSTATAAQVTCKDGTSSKGGQGACSHHGGIATASASGAMMSTPGGGKIPNQQPVKTPTKTGAAADSVGAIAQCTDGMFWDGTVRPGACSGHKGVKRWLAGAPAK
jgi:type IV secretory pathway TrbL component